MRAARYGPRGRIRTADGAGGLALVVLGRVSPCPYMMFRRAETAADVKTLPKPCFYPFGNVLCLFYGGGIDRMLMTPGMAISRVADSGMAAHHGRRLPV